MSDEFAKTLAATVGDHFVVTTTPQGWVEVRVSPAAALRDELDFIRVVGGDCDGSVNVYHMKHNGVDRGEAVFDGSLSAFALGFVREMTEVIF